MAADVYTLYRELYKAYNSAGLTDYSDVILKARALLTAYPTAPQLFSDASLITSFAAMTLPSTAFVAPLLVQEGQSNTGGRDASFTDPSTGLPLVVNPLISFRDNGGGGNQGLRTYPYAGIHGLEYSLGNDLAVAQGSGPVVQGKAWADGTDLQSWLSAGANFSKLYQLVAASKAGSTLRQVAWIQQRGENETQGVSGSSATYQADLATFFALVRGLFGPEYTVRFYVVAVNPHIPTPTNLAAVRAAQSAACAADGNAVYVTDFDAITPSLDGGLHYGSGQTFPMGSAIAARIVVDFAHGLGATRVGEGTDASFADIFGGSLLQVIDANAAATSTLLADQSGNGKDYTGAGLVVTAADGTLAGTRTVKVPRGVSVASTLVTGQPGSAPYSIISVMKILSVNGAAQIVFSPGANNDGFVDIEPSANSVTDFAGTFQGPGFGNAEAVGAWQLTVAYFSNGAQDQHSGGRMCALGSAGNSAASGVGRTINGYNTNADVQLAILLYISGVPTASQLNRLRNMLLRRTASTWNVPKVLGL